MASPWLSVIVPTNGERPDGLRRLLDSIDGQTEASDVGVLLVGDTHTHTQSEVQAEAHRRGPRYRYLGFDGGVHCWGHPQRTAGQMAARGRWLHWMADDDLYAPRAFAAMRAATDALAEPAPLLFKVHTWQSGIVWDRTWLGEGHVDAECLVAPNDPARLGTWGLRYAGDFDMIAATVGLYGGAVAWREELIALARPTAAQDWTSERARLAAA